jgi:thiamine kinase-like enzyme
LFATNPSIGKVIEHCGKSVSYFHKNIRCDEQDVVRIPPEFDQVGHKAFLHGDLNARNVQYDTNSNELVIIDWSLSPAIGRPGNWGSVYWDVAKFVRSIMVEPPVAFTGRRRRRDLADIFLESYVSHSGLGPMGRDFFEYCSRIHGFFNTRNRSSLQWYRYLRYALLNLENFKAYVRERLDHNRVFDGPVQGARAQT